MDIKIKANFTALGLDDPDKKENFSRGFEQTMEEKLGGGNKVIVTSVKAGKVLVKMKGPVSLSIRPYLGGNKVIMTNFMTSQEFFYIMDMA